MTEQLNYFNLIFEIDFDWNMEWCRIIWVMTRGIAGLHHFFIEFDTIIQSNSVVSVSSCVIFELSQIKISWSEPSLEGNLLRTDVIIKVKLQ